MIEGLEQRRLLAAGDLDTTFGAGGFALADFGNGTAIAADVAVDAARGRILVSGTFTRLPMSRADVVAHRGDFTRGVIAAFRLDGTPDTTFSGDGKLVTDLRSIFDLELLPDGRIYALSYLTNAGNVSEPTLVRLRADGSYDPSFGGGDGKVNLPFTGELAAAPGGKAVIVGTDGLRIRAARFNADGSPDTTFGGDGTVLLEYGPPPSEDEGIPDHWWTDDVVVQPDGKIVIAGKYGYRPIDAVVVRLTADGSFDNSFSGDGRQVLGTGAEPTSAVTLAAGGKIVVGASFGWDGEPRPVYPLRLSPDGSLDSLPAPPFTGFDVQVSDVHVTTDGRIVMTGAMSDYPYPDTFLAVYLPSGPLQPGFGGYATGRVTHPAGTRSALSPDDKVLTTSNHAAAQGAIAVARYLTEDDEDTSGTVAVAGGVLSVSGTNRADEIRVTPVAGGKIAAEVNGYRRVFDAASVNRIVVNALAGDDLVVIDSAIKLPATIDGGPGSNELIGGSGDDRIVGGGGGLLVGGSGNDTLVAGPGGDELIGGDGDDQLDGRAGAGHLDGGAGNDLLLGGDSDDNLDGAAGDDTLVGGAGNDFLQGGEGADRLEGGEGPDRLDGGKGDDLLLGEGGNDTILAGSYSNPTDVDTLLGGNGDDKLYAPPQAVVDGGPGIDTINDISEAPPNDDRITFDPNAGVVSVVGSERNDVIRVSYLATPTPLLRVDVQFGPGSTSSARREVPFSDVRRINVYPWDGDDLVDLSGVPLPAYVQDTSGQNLILGGEAGDTLIGGYGDDRLIGNGGDDTFYGFRGADTFSGGAGTDLVDFSARTDTLFVSLNNKADDGRFGEHVNVMDDIEDVIGGSGNDRISGSAANNRLWGGPGNDTLSGGGGKDQLRGNAGNDYLIARGDGAVDFLDGGSGTDRASKDANDFAQFVEQLLA